MPRRGSGKGYAVMVEDRPDFDEQVAYEEIDLYAELVIAAEASDGPLSQDQIDAVLGVRRPDRRTSTQPNLPVM